MTEPSAPFDPQAGAAARSAPGIAAPVGSRNRRTDWVVRLVTLLIAGAIVVLFTTQWNRWVGSAVREETDDAYVRGDVTPLSAQVDGRVTHVAVDDFQYVKAGDLLVQIDDTDYRAKVAQAEADLAGAQAAIDNIKARKDAQKAQVADAESAISATTARSTGRCWRARTGARSSMPAPGSR